MFKATAFEYRFRFWIHGIIFLLGFAAPWNYWIRVDPRGPNAHLWGTLSAELARMGVGVQAYNVVLSVAIVCALAGALLRTWGAAYLGANVVQSQTMHTAEAAPATGILEDGPFRYVRNPLYIGTFLHTLAISLLMPLSGAIFAIAAIALVQSRLILAEEPFLAQKLGAAYIAYCAAVPRILPSLRARVAGTGLKPRWLQAILGEIYMWGVAVSFAVGGWRYDSGLLLKCVIVSFGVSLLVRALAPVGTPQ